MICSLLVAFLLLLPQSGDAPPLLPAAWLTSRIALQERLHLHPLAINGAVHRFETSLQSLAGVETETCDLEFTHDRFTGLMATFRGLERSQRIRLLLERQFGPPSYNPPLGVQWFSQREHIQFDIDSAGDGYLYWYVMGSN